MDISYQQFRASQGVFTDYFTICILHTFVNCEAVQRLFLAVVTENSLACSFNDVFGIGESNGQQFTEIPDGVQLVILVTTGAEFGDHERIRLKRMHVGTVRHNFNRDQAAVGDGPRGGNLGEDGLGFGCGIGNFHCGYRLSEFYK